MAQRTSMIHLQERNKNVEEDERKMQKQKGKKKSFTQLPFSDFSTVFYLPFSDCKESHVRFLCSIDIIKYIFRKQKPPTTSTTPGHQ